VVGHVVLEGGLKLALRGLRPATTLPCVTGGFNLHQSGRGVPDPQHAVDVLRHVFPLEDLVRAGSAVRAPRRRRANLPPEDRYVSVVVPELLLSKSHSDLLHGHINVTVDAARARVAVA
jgi:hypothetical protein